MNKVLKLVAVILLGVFMYANANAGVNFIVGSQTGSNGAKSHSNTNNRPKQTFNTCLKRGYVMTHCPSGSFGADACPDDSSYFKKCCNANVYRFSSFTECAQYGKMPGKECGVPSWSDGLCTGVRIPYVCNTNMSLFSDEACS